MLRIHNLTGTVRSLQIGEHRVVEQTRSIRSERGGTIGTSTRKVTVPSTIDVPAHGKVEGLTDELATHPQVKQLVKHRVLKVETYKEG